MFETFAKSYEYVNGTCVVDGVVQSSTEACSAVAGTAAWIVGLILIPLIIIGIALFVLWVLMLIHVIKNEDIKDRTVWLVVLLGSFLIGSNGLAAIIYYFLAKRPYDRQKATETSSNPTESIAPTSSDQPTKEK